MTRINSDDGQLLTKTLALSYTDLHHPISDNDHNSADDHPTPAHFNNHSPNTHNPFGRPHNHLAD